MSNLSTHTFRSVFGGLLLISLSVAPAEGQPIYDVTDYGAVGNGVVDDSPAINAALAAIPPGERGVLYFPTGVYLTSTTVVLKDGLIVRGAGMELTVITRTANGNSHILEGTLTGISDVIVEDLSVDGAPAEGIRIQQGDHIEIRRVKVSNSGDYGIGLEAGPYFDVAIRDVVVDTSEADGIDIKNTSDSNANVVLERVLVRNPGGSTGAGIDIRGPVSLSKITVEQLNAGQAGVRFRHGEAGSGTGLGGHYSILNDFRIGAGSSTNNTTGVLVNGRNVLVSNGFVRDVKTGIAASGNTAPNAGYKTTISAVNIENVTVGIETTQPDTTIRDCKITNVYQGIIVNYVPISVPVAEPLNNTAIISNVSMVGTSTSDNGITIMSPNVTVGDSFISKFLNGVSISVPNTQRADTTIVNVTSSQSRSSGFKVTDSNDNAGWGSDNVRFTNCRAVNGGGWGWRITSDGVTISGCTASYNVDRGIRILIEGNMTPANTLVTGCHLHNNTGGAWQDQGWGTVFSNNFIW